VISTGSRIIGAGHYQPPKVLTNDDLSKIVDTNDEWIRSRVGIAARHIAGDDDPVDAMAAKAASAAIASAGVAAAEVDMVLVATCTAIDRSPNMAARVAARTGMISPAALDINVACSGFSHALALADQAIRTGSATTAVVIGCERLSDWVDWTDRSTCVLVGDGAGAVVVRPSDRPDIGPVLWGSVPEMADAVRIEGRNGTFEQAGLSVFRWATTVLPKIARQTCDLAGVKPEDLAGVITHQANLRIIEPLAAKLGAVNAVIAKDVVESGNTSSASIPLAFSKLLAQRAIPTGGPVLLFGFGGGLSYAGQVVTFP
jgi:3-oxoacyl-[acyl-carrier-protein] synthase-3